MAGGAFIDLRHAEAEARAAALALNADHAEATSPLDPGSDGDVPDDDVPVDAVWRTLVFAAAYDVDGT